MRMMRMRIRMIGAMVVRLWLLLMTLMVMLMMLLVVAVLLQIRPMKVMMLTGDGLTLTRENLMATLLVITRPLLLWIVQVSVMVLATTCERMNCN